MRRQKLFGWLGAIAVATTMTAACARSDVGVTTAVKTRLAADDTVKAYRIDVDTKDRVVTLKGEVDTQAAKTRAVELARATDGVRDVVDALVVTPGATPTTGIDDEAQRRAKEAGRDAGSVMGDAGITAAVKTKMLADTTVGGLKIDVDTTGGVVALKGNVSSAAEKKRAIEIARETEGVKSVKDELKVVK
jgi:hyperosmotically inducible periplasmic protein